MFAQQRLYLTADKARLVPEDHADAATLYASPGDEIPDSAAERFGLVDGALPAAASPLTPAKKKGTPVKKDGESKATKSAETKDAGPAENKSGDGAAPGDDAPTETKGE